MDLLILNARNSKEMNNISNELALKKFKTIEQDEHYILKKKKRYGNILVHAISLLTVCLPELSCSLYLV